MDSNIVTPGGVIIPARALAWRFSRSGGPGGQGVNTTASRVELLVDLTALITDAEIIERVTARLGERVRVVVTTERSQLRNREIALERLANRIDSAARSKPRRKPTRVSAAADRKRLEAKRIHAQTKAARRDTGDEP